MTPFSRLLPIVLRRGVHDFAVAVWREQADGVGVYEIVEEYIRELSVAAAVARRTAGRAIAKPMTERPATLT